MAFVSGSSNPYLTPLFLNPRAESLKSAQRDLSKEELEEIAFAFKTMDCDNNGFVNPRQLKVSLRALGFPVKKSEVADLLKKRLDDGHDRLGYETFKSVLTEKFAERTFRDDMRRAFQLLDIHGTGKIDSYTLRRVTKSLGMDVSDMEQKAMIEEFDEDGDGMISENEFMAIMAASED
ncbi:hypothetical protein CEUSTIGMA_g6239.t1 [Chlamydomonas eustigma]|uniref:Caltractin n=1 Tax=Chlamydomonas eustigma TaxID=1157962 RepID=A0A250X7D8_9CHLO|nr:hypothetical protein CEUSTIGMA_g6239.t1 [Chlamydomonas eustigma]|eukprot:GAX78802.1 hypothetical protein CEUSTIGMA_g6239.t1 [Chlamydomonas eustigma]